MNDENYFRRADCLKKTDHQFWKWWCGGWENGRFILGCLFWFL